MFNKGLIERFIKHDSMLRGGHFTIFDPETKSAVALNYSKVHKTMGLGHGAHLACVEMATPDGHPYDIDFITKGQTKKDLSISNILIHSADGRERFEWYQDRKTWKTRPVSAGGAGIAESSWHEM